MGRGYDPLVCQGQNLLGLNAMLTSLILTDVTPFSVLLTGVVIFMLGGLMLFWYTYMHLLLQNMKFSFWNMNSSLSNVNTMLSEISFILESKSAFSVLKCSQDKAIPGLIIQSPPLMLN